MLGLLAACSGPAPSPKGLADLLASPNAQPPAVLVMPCNDPVTLPKGPLNEGPAERAWLKDRIALGDCRDSKAALAEFYRRRDKALTK